MISVGSNAPDFKLKDQHGKTVNLSKFTGKKVILSFRPLAWTPVCHDQMLSLEENFDHFEKHDTVAFGIGVDSVPSNKAWTDSLGITNIKMLSDFWPHGEVARAYGVFREADGFSERANIIIDESRKVAFAKIYPIDQLPDIVELLHFIEKQ
jgi:peroxiredoxin